MLSNINIKEMPERISVIMVPIWTQPSHTPIKSFINTQNCNTHKPKLSHFAEYMRDTNAHRQTNATAAAKLIQLFPDEEYP